MFYTYILKSLKNNDIYIGSTENVLKRLKQHNSGQSKSTKVNRPWILLETIEFETRSNAFRQEYFLKTGQQKELLRRKYCK